MTQHITKDAAMAIFSEVTKAGKGFATTQEIMNAAIQHYIDQRAKELPVLPAPDVHVLQSQAERIAELERELKTAQEGWKCECSTDDACRFARERDELREKYNDTYGALDDAARENTSLRAQLAAIAATEPVVEVGGTFTLYWVGSGPIEPIVKKHGIKVGTQLFARPMPAQDVNAELVDALESIIAMENTESNEWDAVDRVIPEMCDTARTALSKYKGAK